jgi:hypothetical protein
VGARIEGLGDRFGSLDTRLETASGRFTDVSGRLETLGQEMAAVGGRVDEVGGQLADQLEPLADELRSRPKHVEIQETLAKIVDATQSDVSSQLGSLEGTVLTLAEALQRAQAPQIPAPREASREPGRDGSREGSRI